MVPLLRVGAIKISVAVRNTIRKRDDHRLSGWRSSNAPAPHLTTWPRTIDEDGVVSESVAFSVHAVVRKSIVVSKLI